MHYIIEKDNDGNIQKIIDPLVDKTLFYSISSFEESFKGNEDRCFICGKTRSEKMFNDEHILPNWILKEFKIHSKQINLPNQTGFTYGGYKIPCCIDCNSEMGKKFEEPISKVFRLSYVQFSEYITSNPEFIKKLFIWLNLIFIKMHLKNSFLQLERNKSLGITDKISDLYGLESIHHTHCIARAFHTHASLCKFTMGSVAIFPALTRAEVEAFDFADNVNAKSILIRINEVAIIAVLNDGCAVLNKVIDHFSGCKAMTPLQLREVFTHFTYASESMENKPTFYSTINKDEGYSIESKVKGLPKFNFSKVKFGDYLYSYCAPLLPDDFENEKKQLKEGTYTFLRDKNNEFIDHSKI